MLSDEASLVVGVSLTVIDESLCIPLSRCHVRKFEHDVNTKVKVKMYIFLKKIFPL